MTDRGDSINVRHPQELYRKYVDERLSIQECADHFGCSTGPIEDRLRKYDIERRGRGNPGMDIPEETLRELYVEEEQTTYELAQRYDCDPTVIERRLRWNEVEVRHTLSGNGEWEDPYGENWEKQREAALERAGYACDNVCYSVLPLRPPADGRSMR